MSKITFRADDDLIDRVERLDTSKSEVMREALREYLDERVPAQGERGPGPGREREDETGEDATLDEMVTERIDALLADRLEAAGGAGGAQDIDLTISLEGVRGATVEEGDAAPASEASPVDADLTDGEATQCGQCGSEVTADHVYCPNCGEKATRRVFCECGDELRSDWAFCPGCGRRTPAADVLDGG